MPRRKREDDRPEDREPDNPNRQEPEQAPEAEAEANPPEGNESAMAGRVNPDAGKADSKADKAED